MFLIYAINITNVEKKFNSFFLCDCLGEVSRKVASVQKKTVLFLFVLCFLAATKTLFKTKENINCVSDIG